MRTLLRMLLVAVVLVAVGLVVFGSGDHAPWARNASWTPNAVGTSGYIDTAKARRVGAEVGEKTAIAAHELKDAAHDAAITSKIKAKMALDDSVKARSIDVTTDGSTVTLSGSVSSPAEHDRAVALARETDGVTNVFDRLIVR